MPKGILGKLSELNEVRFQDNDDYIFLLSCYHGLCKPPQTS